MVVIGWVVANLVVRGVVAAWHGLWCRSVEWSPAGVMPSAEAIFAGKGETAVLFVHGFNDVPYVWKRFVERLSEQGVSCRAMRLPGAGERDCHPTLAGARAAVDAELKALKAAYRRVVLVGHSLGGALALDAVLRVSGASDAVLPDKLVLLAPLVEVSRARSPVFSAETWYRLLRVLFPALRWVPSVFKEYLHAEDDTNFVYRRDRFNEIGWYGMLFGVVHALRRADKARLAVPTDVFVGGNDRVVDSAATIRWFAGLPTVEIREVEGASHVLPLNARWREFALAIQ